MIQKWYCVVCDICGCAENYRGTKQAVIEQAREYGWRITANGVFCGCKKARTDRIGKFLREQTGGTGE